MQNTVNNEILKQKSEFVSLSDFVYLPRLLDKNREVYLKSSLIKVVLGPRRAGKSTFARSMCEGKNVAYLNFDSKILSEVLDHNIILNGINEIYKNIDLYFFDEIQNLSKWEYLINELHRLGKNVIITGSNSRLLSRELSTALTGRNLPIHINTFSYLEYLNATHGTRGLGTYVSYLKIGGYPEMIKSANENYLLVLLDSVILRDIVDRYKVRKSNELESLSEYLLSNPASPYTSRSLEKLLNINQGTITKYIGYLEDVFCVFSLNRFSIKTKERVTSYKKIYTSDIGIYNVKKYGISNDEGSRLEVFVGSELYKKCLADGYSLNYYKTKNGREVDFLLSKNGKTLDLIQVCYEINFNNYKRELTALVEAGHELDCSNLTIYFFKFEEKLREQEDVKKLLDNGLKLKFPWEI